MPSPRGASRFLLENDELLAPAAEKGTVERKPMGAIEPGALGWEVVRSVIDASPWSSSSVVSSPTEIEENWVGKTVARLGGRV